VVSTQEAEASVASIKEAASTAFTMENMVTTVLTTTAGITMADIIITAGITAIRGTATGSVSVSAPSGDIGATRMPTDTTQLLIPTTLRTAITATTVLTMAGIVREILGTKLTAAEPLTIRKGTARTAATIVTLRRAIRMTSTARLHRLA
jgi:hypothetical protein